MRNAPGSADMHPVGWDEDEGEEDDLYGIICGGEEMDAKVVLFCWYERNPDEERTCGNRRETMVTGVCTHINAVIAFSLFFFAPMLSFTIKMGMTTW
jgi:hypothetical protein